jgi:hypothetical protein
MPFSHVRNSYQPEQLASLTEALQFGLAARACQWRGNQ